jgi:protein-L-isoaspartate(D-aspartate) O-methyltransferase
MINRCLFTPNGDNPPFPVPLDDLCTVPTVEMAYLLADLVVGDGKTPQDVLEIGTGSGYQAAILAERCRSLLSIDVRMQSSAALHLPPHVALMVANGYEYDSGELFDAVLVTFGASRIAQAWVKQTKIGGRLVIPLDTGMGCRISVYERTADGLELLDVVAYAYFTPGAEA